MVAYDPEATYTDRDAKQVEQYFVPVSCEAGHELGVSEIMENAEGWCGQCGKPLKKGRRHKVKVGK